MSLVPASQFSLIRARQELDKAIEKGDWDAVRYWDNEIATRLSNACSDDRRDPRALVGELEKILGSYSNVVLQMPDTALKG